MEMCGAAQATSIRPCLVQGFQSRLGCSLRMPDNTCCLHHVKVDGAVQIKKHRPGCTLLA